MLNDRLARFTSYYVRNYCPTPLQKVVTDCNHPQNNASPSNIIYIPVPYEGIYKLLSPQAHSFIHHQVPSTSKAPQLEIVQKQRRERKNAVEQVRYYKKKGVEMKLKLKKQSMQAEREIEHQQQRAKKAKLEKAEALQLYNKEKKRSRQLDVECTELRAQVQQLQHQHTAEIKAYSTLLENSSAVGRELRNLKRKHTLLEAEFQQVEAVAQEKANQAQLQELLATHYSQDPKAPMLLQHNNNTITSYWPMSAARKEAVGDRQLRRRRHMIDNFLGDGITREHNISALTEGKLGKEVAVHLPSHAPATAAQVLALWACKGFSFDQLQACRAAGWLTVTLAEVIALSAQHKIPIEHGTYWDNATHKRTKYGGYIGQNLLRRIHKTITEMVQTNSLTTLTTFAPNIFPICWEIDKGQGYTKLGYHFGCHIKPNGISNLIYMYEADESLSNMWRYFGKLMPTLKACSSHNFEVNNVMYKLHAFVVGDLKLLCEADGHAGNATTYPCIEYEVTQAQLDTVWNPSIPLRTSESTQRCREIVAAHESNPTKKKLISCSNCGEFGHNKNGCSINKVTHKCITCGEQGHCRNSNKLQLSGCNTTRDTADCAK